MIEMLGIKVHGNTIRQLWNRLGNVPGGAATVSKILNNLVPYTGTIGARIVTLGDGHARVSMADRRGVRNHLNSVHAMALANLGEMATGLAVNGSLPEGMRAILKGFQVDYVKKARGRLTSEARFDLPTEPITVPTVFKIEGVITDAHDDVVCKVLASWLVGPK